MRKKGRRLRGSLTVLFLAVLLLSGSFYTARALFSDGETVQNGLDPGEDKVEIEEDFDPPKKPSEGVNVFKKTVMVRNSGNTDAFVRVFLRFSDQSVAAVSGLSADGSHYYSACEGGRPAEVSEKESGILSESYTRHLPENWAYVPAEDGILGGYLYYTGILRPGQSTPALVKKVRTWFASQEAVRPFDILVYVESIQTLDGSGQPFGPEEWRQAWTAFLQKGDEKP